jgi:5-methylcytosine-specific restriction protein A
MAVTTGHGNPNWTRDEVILALALYLECGTKLPSTRDPRVQELSEVLRAFPYHSESARKESFRNADGVSFKLQNLRQVATGEGLSNVSRTDKAVWDELGGDPGRVKYLASLIRTGIQVSHAVREEEPEYEVFAEGRVVTETHLRRERNPKLRARLLEKRRSAGRLHCEVCMRGPVGNDRDIAEAIFEAHHLVPLSAGDARATKLSDLALLCASCHRQSHKAIAKHQRWLSILELCQLLRSAA